MNWEEGRNGGLKQCELLVAAIDTCFGEDPTQGWSQGFTLRGHRLWLDTQSSHQGWTKWSAWPPPSKMTMCFVLVMATGTSGSSWGSDTNWSVSAWWWPWGNSTTEAPAWPNISYALSITSRCQCNSNEGHWIGINNILECLRKLWTHSWSLVIRKRSL